MGPDLFPFGVFTAVWARMMVFLCPSLVFLLGFTHLGTFEAYFVPVWSFHCSLGTFDGVFVPKFSFSIRIHSFGHVWGLFYSRFGIPAISFEWNGSGY